MPNAKELPMRIGFIGLGKMGIVMAERLVVNGEHALVVSNRTMAKAAALVELGAVAGSVAEAAAHGDVVVTMLENDDALNQVLGDGLLASLSAGGVHLCMGTHSLTTIEAVRQAHEQAGQSLVSAPVLGRPPAAAAGQLGVIAAGPADAVARCQPIFGVLGRHTYQVGTEPGSAAAAKIVNNFLLAASIQALGEAFALSGKCGVPADTMCEILTDGLFSGPAHKIYGKMIADKAFFGEPGFSATTGLKDVMLALTAGHDKAVPLPSANTCRDRLLSAIARGDGELDWSVMALEQDRASGLA